MCSYLVGGIGCGDLAVLVMMLRMAAPTAGPLQRGLSESGREWGCSTRITANFTPYGTEPVCPDRCPVPHRDPTTGSGSALAHGNPIDGMVLRDIHRHDC
jgi:hypothetical protein